jgi:hypothetical protein
MLRQAICAVAALGLSAGACGLETSGLLLVGQRQGVTSAADAGAPGTASDAAGGAALALGGPGEGGSIEAGMSDSVADRGGLVDVAPASVPDASVTSSSSGGGSPLDSGSTGVDASDAGGAVFACGAQLLCALPGQTCCAGPGSGNGGGGGSNALTCEDGATCSDPSATALRCTAAVDCAPSQVCCLSQQSSPATAQCSPQCGGGDLQLCDPSARSAGCPAGTACMGPQAQGHGGNQLPNGVGSCG